MESDQHNSVFDPIGKPLVYPVLSSVTPSQRALLAGQQPFVVWFTGLPSSGKTTLANLLELSLHKAGRHTFFLDGDDFRSGLNRDLGFTEAARSENLRRAAHVVMMMLDAGLIVLCAFVSPSSRDREQVRLILEGRPFVEVFVDCPLSIAETRDPKGLYRKARLGKLPEFTGIGSSYQVPISPDVRLDAGGDRMPSELVSYLLEELRQLGLVSTV